MAYDSQHVLAIIHDGSPVREINGQVRLPFGSEYKIRLKNKHSYLRTKVRVWIDGRLVSNLGDFILRPNQTLDLERFLDSSLDSGNKFQFVPLSDGRVNDPTDSENGIVKVEFYREIDNQFRLIVNPPKPIYPRRSWDNTGAVPLRYDGPYTYKGLSDVNYGSTFTWNSNVTMNVSSSLSDAGATVEGGRSAQGFNYGEDFPTEIWPVTLTLRLKGFAKPRNSPAPPIVTGSEALDTTHANKPSPKERFCSNCGKRRSRMKDRFCSRCGHPFKQVR